MTLPSGVELAADPELIIAVVSVAPTAEQLEGDVRRGGGRGGRGRGGRGRGAAAEGAAEAPAEAPAEAAA